MGSDSVSGDSAGSSRFGFHSCQEPAFIREKCFNDIHKKAFLTQFIAGLLCSLTGAFLMFNGELLGDNTTGIARILGIMGICLIATATPIGIAVKKKS
jgi:ABC-type Mn2+/Zn2+ transport system permease subunit